MKSIRRSPLPRLALALLLLAAAPVGHAAGREPPQPSVVVRVDEGGFHWLDAAVGGAATLAAGLLVLGLVLTFRPAGRRTR